jgi:hypothetical protein
LELGSEGQIFEFDAKMKEERAAGNGVRSMFASGINIRREVSKVRSFRWSTQILK